MKRKRGFTLIELLVSSLILSIIMLSLYSVFHTGILSYKKIDSAFGAYQRPMVVLNRLESELKNSFAYTAVDSRFSGGAKTIEFFTVIDSFDNLGNLRPVFCRIKYESSGEVLKRTLYPGQDALKEGLDLEPEVMSSDIKDIGFQYATGETDAPAPWQESWPSEEGPEQKITLPLAVRVTLAAKEKGVTFAKDVYLPQGLR